MKTINFLNIKANTKTTPNVISLILKSLFLIFSKTNMTIANKQPKIVDFVFIKKPHIASRTN